MKKRLFVSAGLAAAMLFVSLFRVMGVDTPNTILGTPISGVTSNTAVLYEFLSARSVSSLGIAADYLTITTTDQTVDDGTSVVASRVPLRQWLEITNLTTYTVYLALNCGLQPVGTGETRSYINETTPTLSPLGDEHDFRLDPYTSALPYRLQINAVDSPWLFAPEGGIWNVGAYFYDASTDYYSSASMQSQVTSATMVLKGR